MKILITPEDIVKRCLWDNYTYYVVGSEKESEKILKENLEFELTERQAIVIGLIKVMETDNLIFRFNDYITHFLSVRSIKDKDLLYIKKKSLEVGIEKFMDKFPNYWVPSANWSNSLKLLMDYINYLRVEIEKLEITKIPIQNISYEFINSNSVKKLLNFNNY